MKALSQQPGENTDDAAIRALGPVDKPSHGLPTMPAMHSHPAALQPSPAAFRPLPDTDDEWLLDTRPFRAERPQHSGWDERSVQLFRLRQDALRHQRCTSSTR